MEIETGATLILELIEIVSTSTSTGTQSGKLLVTRTDSTIKRWQNRYEHHRHRRGVVGNGTSIVHHHIARTTIITITLLLYVLTVWQTVMVTSIQIPYHPIRCTNYNHCRNTNNAATIVESTSQRNRHLLLLVPPSTRMISNTADSVANKASPTKIRRKYRRFDEQDEVLQKLQAGQHALLVKNFRKTFKLSKQWNSTNTLCALSSSTIIRPSTYSNKRRIQRHVYERKLFKKTSVDYSTLSWPERREKSTTSVIQLDQHLIDSNLSVSVNGSITNNSNNTNNKNNNIISDPHELRRKVLDEKIPLKELNVRIQRNYKEGNDSELQYTHIDSNDVVTNSNLVFLNHTVIELIVRRYNEQTTPGNRSNNDHSILALSLEGGGMRGAVTAGMAAAIASLGLSDCFDTIYGSSAGSVIGTYMVSRQMCMDVYVDILPAAKQRFVCFKRIISALAISVFDWVISKLVVIPKFVHKPEPGMNISFVLDGIMDTQHGIRPLDIEQFRKNDQKQPLRVVSSYVKSDGTLHTKCFGTKHFWNDTYPQTVAKRSDALRQGLFACLEASMTVPGAAGPPVLLLDNLLEPTCAPNDSNSTISNVTTPATMKFFDAFCFEPLPYRSAVHEGATHVLVLCSRPDGYQPKTIPGVYERAIAPLFFRSNNEPEMATFFECGGQQYIYAEDLLVLEEGKYAGIRRRGLSQKQQQISSITGNKTKNNKVITNDDDDDDEEALKVVVPPPVVLYGVERDATIEQIISHRTTSTTNNNNCNWKRAHLLPIKVPIGTPELSTLEQSRDAVIDAVCSGYAAAFDLLAPAIGVQLENSMTGMDVARMLFSRSGTRSSSSSSTSQCHANKKHSPTSYDNVDHDDSILMEQIRVRGDDIKHIERRQKHQRTETENDFDDGTLSVVVTDIHHQQCHQQSFISKNACNYQDQRPHQHPSNHHDRKTSIESRNDDLCKQTTHYPFVPRKQNQATTTLTTAKHSSTASAEQHRLFESKAAHLLRSLPGFSSGRMAHLASNLLRNPGY